MIESEVLIASLAIAFILKKWPFFHISMIVHVYTLQTWVPLPFHSNFAHCEYLHMQHV